MQMTTHVEGSTLLDMISERMEKGMRIYDRSFESV